MALTVALGRNRARNASHETLVGEIAAATPDDADEIYDIRRTASQEEDKNRAALVALSFASYWLLSASKARVEGLEARKAVAAANASQAHRVKMVATTETATAFNFERRTGMARAFNRGPVLVEALPGERLAVERIARRAAQRERLVLFKVWDAEADACPECADAHGAMVPADEDFPEGIPGDVHPNCRCVAEVVLLPWWEALAA